MKFHFVVKFPFLKNVKVFLEGRRVRGVRDGSIQKAVISEEADFSTRRKVIVDIVDVDEEKQGPEDSTLGYPREDRTRVRKCAVDKDTLRAAFEERRRPVQKAVSNAVFMHFDEKGGVIYFVKSFREI